MQPGQGSFDHPAINAQAAAMGRVALGQEGLNASLSQPVPIRSRVVAAIALNAFGPAARSAQLAPHWRNGLHQGAQLGVVVDVGLRQEAGQGNASSVRNQVMLAARFRSVGRIRPGFVPPFSARREALSTTARDQSSWLAPWSLASKTSCKCCQTPAACQSRSRRQQVIPLPQPISCGRSSHPMPVFSTNKIPVNARRLSIGFRPGYRNRRGLASGKIGSSMSQSSSSTSGFAIGQLFPLSVAQFPGLRLPRPCSFC